tara:strand:+ start:2185 stop:3549 length:1365 start_codon:yes stop_codon:yes gene_type:complete
MEQFFNKIIINKKIKKNSFFLFIFLTLFTILLISVRADPVGSVKVDLPGFVGLTLVALITVYVSYRNKSLASILYLALAVRLITIFLGDNFIILPDSWGDATRYEQRAWEMSQDGFFGVFGNFPNENASFHISWIIAFFYSLTDRSPLMCQSIILIFGMGSVFFGSQIANKIWNKKISLKVGWILALYPTLILYSCLILREAFIWFFLLVALYGIISWIKNDGLKSYMFIFIGFIGASFFHGAMFIGGLIFITILIYTHFIKIIKGLNYLKISTSSLIIFILSIISIFFIISYAKYIPKFGDIGASFGFENILIEISNRNIKGASFPEWTVPKTSFELLYKTPIRIIYFMFSPFPWDITKTSHLFGLLDGTFFLIMTFVILKNFQVIWNDKTLRILFIILLAYLAVYGLATGNFGTGIRHRTKFVIPLILLAAPWLPSFVFNKNKQIIIKKNYM